jgi:hypothetical protein
MLDLILLTLLVAIASAGLACAAWHRGRISIANELWQLRMKIWLLEQRVTRLRRRLGPSQPDVPLDRHHHQPFRASAD